MTLSEIIAENDFFQGGLVLKPLGAAWAIVTKYGKSVLKWLLHRVAITIKVDNQSLIFDALSTWFDESKALGRVRRLRYESQRRGDYTASPSAGTHLIRLLGRWVIFNRDIATEKSMWGKPHETFTITIPFITRKGIETWIEEAMALHEQRAERIPMIWSWRSGYWRRIGRVPERPVETVSLAGTKLQDLLSDIREFRESRERYRAMGVPWRRGYLFSGDPGTGKSTTAITVANEAEMSVAYLSLASKGLDDSALISAITELPKHTILLLEDIDAAVPDRLVKKKKRITPNPSSTTSTRGESSDDSDEDRGGITLSGLLNALDGIISPEGLVVIMTTNYPERLDSALLRPGRADYPVTFDLADAQQAKSIVKRITGDQLFVDAVGLEISEHGPIAHAYVQQAALGAKEPGDIHSILYKARFEGPGKNTI